MLILYHLYSILFYSLSYPFLFSVKQNEQLKTEVSIMQDETEDSAQLVTNEEYEHPMSKLPWYSQWFYKLKRVVYLSCLFVPCICTFLHIFLLLAHKTTFSFCLHTKTHLFFACAQNDILFLLAHETIFCCYKTLCCCALIQIHILLRPTPRNHIF